MEKYRKLGPPNSSGRMSAAAELAGGHLSRKLHSLEELPPGKAAILKVDDKNRERSATRTGAP